MNELTVSIIIPVYNCEQYINRCLDSVVAQVDGIGEIIVIDDGSTDKTGELVNAYAEQHECIKYLPRQNGGVSFARNEGIENAQGKYLMFCDADDWFESDCIAMLIDKMEQSCADIGKFGAYSVTDSRKTPMQLPLKEGIYKGDNLKKEYLYKMIGPSNSEELNRPVAFGGNIWSHIIKRSIVSQNNIRFDRRLFHSEDQLFVINALIHSQTLLVCEKNCYNYYRREGSAVRSFNPKMAQNALDYCSLLDKAAEEGGINEQTKTNRSLNLVRTCFTIAEYIFSASNSSTKQEKLEQAKQQLDSSRLNDALQQLDFGGIKPIYKALYRCLKRKDYKGYMRLKNMRNFIYKLRH